MASAETDLDAEAERLIADTFRPKRRVRPRLAQPLQDAEGRMVETPSGEVMAWRLGVGPAVLLVHGWNDDNALWGPMIDRVRANGRAVVVLDLPGHGFSPAEMQGPKPAGMAVRAVAEALGPIEAAVSHSFGCFALMAALASGLGVERAVLIATPIQKNRAGWIEQQRELGAPPEVVARAMDLFTTREDTGSSGFVHEAAAARMTAKALIIHSMDDEQCSPENARIIADAWPNAELLWTDDLGHRAVAQDSDVTARVADFIEGFG